MAGLGLLPALIELAFDRTVLNCGRLNWKYCHGILESWRKNGLFTMADVLEKDAPPQKPETAPEPEDPWPTSLIPREIIYSDRNSVSSVRFLSSPANQLYKKECPGLSYTDLLNVTTV